MLNTLTNPDSWQNIFNQIGGVVGSADSVYKAIKGFGEDQEPIATQTGTSVADKVADAPPAWYNNYIPQGLKDYTADVNKPLFSAGAILLIVAAGLWVFDKFRGR